MIRDAAAVLPTQAAEVVVDHLELVAARFTAQPYGKQRTIRVATSVPVRCFVIALKPEAASFHPVDAHDGSVDLEFLLKLSPVLSTAGSTPHIPRAPSAMTTPSIPCGA